MFATNETMFATNETMFATNETMFATNETMFATNETMFATNETMFATNETMFEDIALICISPMSSHINLRNYLPQFLEAHPTCSQTYSQPIVFFDLCLIP
jgi:hypothetical protein